MTSSREAKQYPQAVPMLFHYSLRFFARFESASRYYILRCEPDLLGDLVVSRFWGGKGSRCGGEKHERVPSLEAGLKLLASIVRTRQRHGYDLIDA